MQASFDMNGTAIGKGKPKTEGGGPAPALVNAKLYRLCMVSNVLKGREYRLEEAY